MVVLLTPNSRASTPDGPEAASPLTGLGLLSGVLPAFCGFTAFVAAREARADSENLNFLAAKNDFVAGTARKNYCTSFC